MNGNVACFTGYRPQKCPWGYNENDSRCIKMKKILKVKIETAIENGIDTFLCGMAIGFDMICAEIVLSIKKEFSHIKLIGILPCKNQDSKWCLEYKLRYKRLLKKLDDLYLVSDNYYDGCMQERNRYMIDNSSYVIALFDGKSGGTSKTLTYARLRGLNIDIIKP